MNFWVFENETLIAMGNDAVRVMNGVSKNDAGPAAQAVLDEIIIELEERKAAIPAEWTAQ